MLISKVELENVKNYDKGSFEFGPGVTAISGPNGAGKTTILEAIAWALFDQLPYKKEDFLRRGAKKGSVRVTFVSALDGREYTVYRDTGAGYYIYDPITKFKLVEQKSQVGGWIKQHIGVETGTDLKTLFTSTIGVPQGTFTVDFSDQPAKRKVGFDKVLRVDEYQRSSEGLRSLVRLIESKESELREEIARIEGEIGSLDMLLDEKSSCETEIERLKQELSAAEQGRERARMELKRLDDLQKSLDRMAGEEASLSIRSKDLSARRAGLLEEVSQSKKASKAVESAAEGFESYNDSNRSLGELEPRAALRDEIRKEHAEKEREIFRLETSIQSLRERLSQIESDKAEMERLAPLVVEQENLESKRAELQTSLGELAALRERVEIAESELESLRKKYSDVTKRIAETEKLKDAAERAPQLEDDRRKLESQLREAQIGLERLTERKKELKRARESLARLNGEIITLEKDMSAGVNAESVAATLPHLEAEDQAAMERIATLKASIDREKKILSEVKEGLCPLLSQRCLNMKEGEDLDQYFKGQMGNEKEQLKTIEQTRKSIQRRLADARIALKASSAVASQRVQLSRLKEDMEIRREEVSRLESEIKESNVSGDIVSSLADQLGKLDMELRQAQAAISKYESLGILKEQLERLKTEGAEKRSAHESLKERLAAMSGLQNDLADLEKQIIRLDDPRGRVRHLKASIENEEGLKESLLKMESNERTLVAAGKELLKRFEEFEGIDEMIAQERIRRAAAEKDYRSYIENQPIAALLGSRESELNEIEKQFGVTRNEIETVKQAIREAKAVYNEEKHSEIKRQLEELMNRVASLGSELNSARQRIERLNTQIEKLLVARNRLTELAGNLERCSQLLGISEFIRDLLRKAGPFITEAHLQSISIEANQLYREITGNPMVSLRWDMGYEIILEEDGHERPFASLSGGEQMAAALSVRLALLKELSDMRIAFFDEPTTNMDEERRRNLAQQIGRIKDFDQLFVISHDDTFEGFTDRVIPVRSQMEES